MKLIQLTAISAAILASTAALAAEPVAYQADANASVVGNTVSGTKGFFNKVVNPASVSAEVGTLGYGANIGWSLNDKTELQAGWAGGDAADLLGGDFDANDVNYDVDTDFSNPYLGVQVRPMANWFTMGAGIIVPDNDIDVRANAEGEGFYRINSEKFYAGSANVEQIAADDFGGQNIGNLEGTIEHRNKLAPYATIGFRPNITNNFGLFGEVGAAYMGKVDATINRVAGNTNPAADIAADQAEKDLEDKNWLEWMPIAKVGATYRF